MRRDGAFRADGAPMSGFPLHKLDHFLRQLLSAGHRVAVVEQMEAPNPAIKAPIRREVTRHGLGWERTAGSLPWQHVVVFRKAP